MKSCFKYILATVVLIQLSSCGDPGFSDLEAVLDVTGEKLDKGSARTGAARGYSWWTFDGSDLKVEYTGQLNATIEQQILNSGSVFRETEEYTIKNLEPVFDYDEQRNEVRKAYWGDWDNHLFYFGLKYGENGYFIQFQVTWTETANCIYTHNLSGEDNADILKRFLITDEADENFIAAKDEAMSEAMSELNEERFRDLTADKEHLELAFKSLGVPTQHSFEDKLLFFIDEYNATLNGSSEGGLAYIDENNLGENSITIDGKRISLAQFKKDLVSFISDKVDSLPLLQYLYVARENSIRDFYYYPDPGNQRLSEVGFEKFDERTLEEYKNMVKRDGLGRLYWNDIYLILFKDELGGGEVMKSYIYKHTSYDHSVSRRREPYGLGNVYFSTFNPEFYDGDIYSLHDKLSIFSGEYSFSQQMPDQRWGYSYRLEDFIGYCTSEFLFEKVTDFTFTNAKPDLNYIAIKLSPEDTILSRLRIERDHNSFSWDDIIPIYPNDSLSLTKVDSNEVADEPAPATEELE